MSIRHGHIMASASYGHQIDGYRIEGSTIRFALDGPNRSGDGNGSVELVFRDVEGYLFERRRGTETILAVEESSLDDFLIENEAFFAREARFGWPRFWQGCAEQTAGWLAYRGRHVWNVSTSYGLSGWVVAGSAACHNAARKPQAAPTSLAAWRIPSSTWRP